MTKSLQDYEIDELYQTLLAAESSMKIAKDNMKRVQDEINGRYQPTIDSLVDEANKDTGTFHAIVDGYKVTQVVAKSVKWDSDELQELASSLTWDEVQSLFQIEFSMSEAQYDAMKLGRPDLSSKVDAARTLTPTYRAVTIKPID